MGDDVSPEGNGLTLLEQTRGIRADYQSGKISPAEARRRIKPFYEQYVTLVKQKATTAGMKAPRMTLQQFLARRSDLRYEAQQQAIEQLHQQQGEL